jgi:anaerobic magnesium-protoporphyrin IX monomethyl ester cyclase
MKPEILIVFPPQWTPVSPYSALPFLRAALLKYGIEARLLDLNCDAYDRLLTGSYLRELRLPDDFMPNDPRHRFRWLLTFREELADRVDEARAVMRTGSSFYDRKRYLYAENTLRYALYLISLAYWPQQIGLDSLDLGIPSDRLFSAEEMERPFGAFVFEDAIKNILGAECWDACAVVGFSVHTKNQLFYALRIIRRYCLQGKRRPRVVLGGTLLASLHKYSSTFQPVFDAGVDAIVYARGDETLTHMCRRATDGSDFRSCDGILFSDGRSVYKNRAGDRRRGLFACDLDYSDLLPGKYLSPEPIVNIPASTGCSWGKCRFCNYHDRYSVLDASCLSSLMQRMGTSYRTSRFFLAQSALDYNQAFDLSSLSSGQSGYAWGSLARIDERATVEAAPRLYAAGCRKLSFGLESRSLSLREKMNKGPLSKELEPFFKRCHDVGIGVEIFLVVGYPGETIRDIRQTLGFIRHFLPCIDAVSANQFSLVCNSVFFAQMRRDDAYAIDEEALSFFEVLDQQRPWKYRNPRKALLHERQVRFFWEGLIEIAEESPAHLWRGNTAFRAAIPRIPEHQFLYLASPGRVTNADAVSLAQSNLVPRKLGDQTLFADMETMTIAAGNPDAP